MSLSSYLPATGQINACIKPEAEGAHEAILLAVHRPAPLSYRFFNTPEQFTVTTEDELLDYVLTKNVPMGALVVPVTGVSGVGKSHLIRVIDARLRQSANADRLVIIRIPKSASLRKVVELILEPLPDGTYSDTKAAFSGAMSEIDVESAAVLFRGQLTVALNQYAKSLEESVRRGQVGSEARLDHAMRVKHLFDDPVTSPHFLATVFPRIVHRAVVGSDSEAVDALASQFTAADFELPTSISISHAAKPTQMYYTLAVSAGGGKGRVIAAEVLNAVVDEAIHLLFKLQDSIGGMTLQEVILEIRRLLLAEGKELVLLIEDFAALTGIQEALSMVLIQEGIRDDEQVYATMRSVIAVTDGWTIGRAGFETRAQREWIVESKIGSDDQVISRTRAMVASYLNAARWGREEVIAHYEASKGDSRKGTWLPAFRQEGDDEYTVGALNAFGIEEGVPLFPFTGVAITHLARRALTTEAGLIFNPRVIINQILRKMLLPARHALERNDFPSPEMETLAPSSEIAEWANRFTPALRARYARVAVVWGDNPQNLAALAQVPPGIFLAFGLTVPDLGILPNPNPAPNPNPNPNPPPPPPPPPPPLEDLRIAKFRGTLESWVQRNERLPQSDALAIRKALADVLADAIDLNCERCRDMSITAKHVSIPNSGGETGLASEVIAIASDAKDEDGRLRIELLAIYRMRVVYQNNESYDEFENDLARTSNLVDRLMPKALAVVRSQIAKQVSGSLGPLAMSSRVLGISEPGKSLKAVHEFFFQSPSDLEATSESSPSEVKEWRSFQGECQLARSMLQAQLLKGVGCFQGTGKTPLAVDIVRLAEHHRANQASSEEPVGLTAQETQWVKALAEPRTRARAKVVLHKASALTSGIEAELGSDFDKSLLVQAIQGLAESLQGGNWDAERIGIGYPSFKKLCETFRGLAVKESLGVLSQIGRKGAEGSQIVVMAGQLKFEPLLAAEQFVTVGRALVRYANQHAQTQEKLYEGADPAIEVARIKEAFRVIESSLGALSEGDKNGPS